MSKRNLVTVAALAVFGLTFVACNKSGENTTAQAKDGGHQAGIPAAVKNATTQSGFSSGA